MKFYIFIIALICMIILHYINHKNKHIFEFFVDYQINYNNDNFKQHIKKIQNSDKINIKKLVLLLDVLSWLLIVTLLLNILPNNKLLFFIIIFTYLMEFLETFIYYLFIIKKLKINNITFLIFRILNIIKYLLFALIIIILFNKFNNLNFKF